MSAFHPNNSDQPNTNASLDFLKKMYPDGPWCLTAIDPKDKGISTATFYPDDKDLEVPIEKWLGNYIESRNIYWHVNPVMQRLKKKAERTDILNVSYLHVDVDPGIGKDLEKEQDAILSLFDDELPKGIPKPSCLIFSGGGYQAFWKLEEPISINGDLELAEDAKRYNQQLELLFGADNCHNIDRLMRLPGTTNIPDARKRKKGRVRANATVIWCKPEITYPASKFTQASIVQTDKDVNTAGSKTVVNISGNVKRTLDLDELNEWNVTDRVKIIIAQGAHPDAEEVNKKRSRLGREPSRSEWLFDVVCNLVRLEVPDDVVFGIITDPDWPISESVVELKGRAEKYAIKQLTSAKEFVIDPVLAELNEKYFVVKNFGGKCVVVSEEYDCQLNRMHIQRQSFSDFKNALLNEQVQVATKNDGTPVWKTKGEWWLKHPKRRQYERVVFKPDGELKGEYNLWKGFGSEPCPGKLHLSFLSHLYINLCGKDPEKFKYLVRWMAVHIQFPAQPGHVAVVVRGRKGTGKSFFGVQFGKLFGSHFMHVTQESHVTGQFNSHLRHTKLLFVDEALNPNIKKHDSILKTLITEQSFSCEAKGIDAEPVSNYMAIIIASNEKSVVRATEDERRYFVLEANDAHIQDTDYFGGLCKDLEAGGYAHLLYFLQKLDLGEFNIRSVPKTDALKEQIAVTESTPYDDKLDDYLAGTAGAIHPAELWKALREEKPYQKDKLDLGKAMRKLGWERRRLRCNGRNTEFWCKGKRPSSKELVAVVLDDGQIRSIRFERKEVDKPRGTDQSDVPF